MCLAKPPQQLATFMLRKQGIYAVRQGVWELDPKPSRENTTFLPVFLYTLANPGPSGVKPSSTPGPSEVALTYTPGPSGMALTSTPGPSGVVPNLSMEAVETDSDVDLPLVNVTKSLVINELATQAPFPLIM